jgi:hypothetical protein
VHSPTPTRIALRHKSRFIPEREQYFLLKAVAESAVR